MKAEFISRGRVKAETGAHLFEGVDISGIYDDDGAGVWPESTPHRQSAAAVPAVVIGNREQTRRDRRAAQARRSRLLEKAWIYVALITAFAVVIGISTG